MERKKWGRQNVRYLLDAVPLPQWWSVGLHVHKNRNGILLDEKNRVNIKALPVKFDIDPYSRIYPLFQ